MNFDISFLLGSKKVVLVTGGFDPIHSGHIAYLKSAKKLGDKLVVGINSDEWLARKKGQAFMPWSERAVIIRELGCVDEVIEFDDSDGSACDAIRIALQMVNYDSMLIFANGGDRSSDNIPEMRIKDHRLVFTFCVGGDNKLNSSSKILTEWKNPKTERVWGYYRVLHSDGPSMKVKELVVNPGKTLSMQRHAHRSEYWIVSSGVATVNLKDEFNGEYVEVLEAQDEIHIPVGTWHQLQNNTTEEVRVVEIQYGTNCIEEDIERI